MVSYYTLDGTWLGYDHIEYHANNLNIGNLEVVKEGDCLKQRE